MMATASDRPSGEKARQETTRHQGSRSGGSGGCRMKAHVSSLLKLGLGNTISVGREPTFSSAPARGGGRRICYPALNQAHVPLSGSTEVAAGSG